MIQKTVFGLSVIMLLFLSVSCVRDVSVEGLNMGKTLRLTTPGEAGLDNPSLSEDYIVWADSRDGYNRTCGKDTCNYNVFALNLKTGKQIQVTDSLRSEYFSVVDSGRLAWVEMYPRECVTIKDNETNCTYPFKVWMATGENFVDKNVIFEAHDSYKFKSMDLLGNDLIIEVGNRNFFNMLIHVDLSTGESTQIPTQKPRNGITSGITSDPVISPNGIVWFASSENQADKIKRTTRGYDLKTGVTKQLSPPGGFGIREKVIDLSRSDTGIVWVQADKGNWVVWHYNDADKEYKKLYETDQFLRTPLLSGDNVLIYRIKHKGFDEVYARNLKLDKEVQLTKDKLLILDVDYVDPYLSWTVWGTKKDVRFKKWTWE